MKLFGQKSISSLLHLVAGIATSIFTIGFLFICISLLAGNMTVNEENRFIIKIPFTNSVFEGIHAGTTFAAILGFLLFYAFFFFLLRLIFRVFKQQKIFSTTAIRNLKWFAILNTIFPPFYILVAYWATQSFQISEVMPPILHVVIGVFSLFIMAIFKQGFQIQEENDLTI